MIILGRRRFLQVGGVGVLASLAGCQGGPDTDENGDAQTPTATPTATDVPTPTQTPTATLTSTQTPSPVSTATPQPRTPRQAGVVVAGDGDANDAFGHSVALLDDGATAVIGAPADEDPNGREAGAAYVFTRRGGDWVAQAKLVAPDGGPGDHFGRAVAGTTGRIVVGAPRDATENTSGGAAYVFTQSNGEWRHAVTLAGTDGGVDDRFGDAVAVSNDTVFVGAWQAPTSAGDPAGAAYVFEPTDGDWDHQTRLTPRDGDADDRFGWAVAATDDTVLIGASRDEDPNGPFAGAVYHFQRDGGAWQQAGKLTASDGDSADLFGSSIAVAGQTAIIGARRDDDPNGSDGGAAYVVGRVEGTWQQTAKLAASDGDTGDSFGRAVGLAGDTAVIGAFRDEDPHGSFAGAAYAFTRVGDRWRETAKFVPEDGRSGARFGLSIAAARQTVVVGAPTADQPNGPGSGVAYLFILD